MNRKFKSYEQAQQVGEKLKEGIQYINFRSKSIKLDEKADNGGDVVRMEGYASTKDRDRYGDVVLPEAFAKTMDLFMTNPMLLLQHDMKKQIGVIAWYSIDTKGLYINADVKYKAGDDELFEKIMNGDLKGFSIGFRIKDLEFIEEEINGETMWTLIIKELELLEISVVTIPANPYTLAKSIDDLIQKSVDEVWAEVENGEGDEPTGEDEEDGDTPTAEELPETEETPAEWEEEDGDEGAEKSKFDETPADDKIEETPATENPQEPEKQEEVPAGEETPGESGTEEGKGEKGESLTLKMIEKIVEAKTEKFKKSHEAMEKTLRDELQKEYDEKIKSLAGSMEEVMSGLLGIIQNQGDQIKAITEGLKSFSSWKGLIYTEEEIKDLSWGRQKDLLVQFEKAKQLLHL